MFALNASNCRVKASRYEDQFRLKLEGQGEEDLQDGSEVVAVPIAGDVQGQVDVEAPAAPCADVIEVGLWQFWPPRTVLEPVKWLKVHFRHAGPRKIG